MLSKNRYIWAPLTKIGSDAPVGSGTSAHVAPVPARLQATSAEVPEPTGVTDQKSKMGASICSHKLSFLQIYKKFCDIVASPIPWLSQVILWQFWYKQYRFQSQSLSNLEMQNEGQIFQSIKMTWSCNDAHIEFFLWKVAYSYLFFM